MLAAATDRAPTNPPTAAIGSAPRPVRRLLILAVPALVTLAVLISLGSWQLGRLAWKEELIARVESRTTMAPVPAPAPESWPGLDIYDLDYTPVTVRGHFDNDREVHVYGNLTDPHGPVGGQGYFVMTPLVTDAGWTVIVNRGFVPAEWKDPASRPEGQIAGETEVTGLLRPPQGRNPFTPEDDPARDAWFTRDPSAIGAALGIDPSRLAPYTIDARFDPDLPGGLPQGGETLVSFPNNHLQYVVTWFGLALSLVGIYAAYAVSLLRRRRGALEESRAERDRH